MNKDQMKRVKALVSVMNPKALSHDIFKNVPLARVRSKNPRAKSTKPRQHKEQTLSGRIGKDLDFLELQGIVIHHDRLNSGMAQRAGYYIKLCKGGTADRVIYCENKLVIFIETKGDGKQTLEQKEFQVKMEKCSHKYFVVESLEKWEGIKNCIISKQNIYK